MMHRIVWGILLALLGLSGCTTTQAIVLRETVTVTSGDGGSVYRTREKYNAWGREGKQIIIDGQVISADAFAAFSAWGACYTENAQFSPHAASYAGLVPNYAETVRIAQRLPQPLRDAFLSSNVRYNWIGWKTWDYDDLVAIWPEGECKSG